MDPEAVEGALRRLFVLAFLIGCAVASLGWMALR